MKVTPVEVAEEEAPYTVVIQTGANYPQLRTIQTWHDGTMILTINPGSDATESKRLEVESWFPINTEGAVKVDFWLPKTIGVPKLLMVYLTSNYTHKGKKHALFVREVTILYDRKSYRFPIRNFIYPHDKIGLLGTPSLAKMGCPPHLLVREGAGTLRHQETEDFIIKARQRDLETIQSMVVWNTVVGEQALLTLGHCGVKKYDHLPRFLQFRKAKQQQFQDLQAHSTKAVIKAVIKNFMNKLICSYKIERVGSFEEYKKFIKLKSDEMGWPKEAAFEAMKVAEKFQDEEEFGRQMLCGPNALQIRKVESLEGKWKDGVDKVQDDKVHRQTLEGKILKLKDAMEQGRLFEVNTDSLTEVPHGGKASKSLTGKKQTWYVTLSDCMLYQTDSGKLVPVLIRLENRNDEEAATFWTPPDRETSKEDPKYLAWLLAKMYFRCADVNVYGLCTHFARGHAINEIFAVAAYRNLSSAHPMLRLLQPHIDGIIPVNVQARKVLVKEKKNVFSMFLSTGDNLQLVFLNYYKQFSYQDLLVPDDIEKRGVKDIPEYLYRDDMLAHWELIKEYIGGMVALAYPKVTDVSNDVELQNFITEIVKFGFRGFEIDGAGFPTSISDNEKLTEYLTAIVVNISTFHTAVNFQTFTTYSFAPNAPCNMTKPPPKQDEEITMDRILKSLPVAVTTFLSMDISFQLGQFSPIEKFYLDDPAENKLGIIGENMAVSPKQVDCIRRLTEGMRRLKDKIDARNDGREIKYDVLSPVNTPITTQT